MYQRNMTGATLQKISISVVSHLQSELAEKLLSDIERFCSNGNIEVILTLNLPEETSFKNQHFSFPIIIINNKIPLGFAANHNQAFAQSSGKYFCVMNPDIRLNNNPFHPLISCLEDSSIGVVAPMVLGKSGEMEDSARRFPTPLKILCKAFGGCESSDYVVKEETVYPDWVAGMFMLFTREVFAKFNGFDLRFFLYYEDVDLCGRMKLQGYRAALCPSTKVVHLARRESRRRLKYMKWHLTSMLRFFVSKIFLKILLDRLT
jgi:GT2 family glycosyltransferase